MRVLCGTDLVQIERFERAMSRQGERFLSRLFTARELAQCQGKSASLAARFAAKEAIAKALGTGIGPHQIAWTDLEIVRQDSGQPTVELHAAAARFYAALGGQSIAISLTHEQYLAQAFCVLLIQD